MRSAPPLALALASVFVWVACDTQQPTAPDHLQPSFEISDANHNNGMAGFYWLPPLVSPADYSGTFRGYLSPRVEICPWDPSPDPENPVFLGCGTPVWNFDRTSGPAGHRVGVDVNGQSYHLNWDTNNEEVPAKEDFTYRISVWLGPAQLGFIDVHFGATGQDAKSLRTNEIIPLNEGRTLPIKFRIGIEMSDIAYHSGNDGDLDVYLFDSESGVSVNLTEPYGTIDGTPSWAPDGSKIAFASDRADPGSSPDVWVMNADGSNPVQLTFNGGWKPAWSPDGAKIAFQKGWPPGCDDDDDPYDPCRQQDIWIMDADGQNQEQVTDDSFEPGADPYEDQDPAWRDENHLTWARSHNEVLGGDCLADQPYFWVGGDVWNTCNFDIVGLDFNDPTVHLNYTQTKGVDQLSPAWSAGGARLLFSQEGQLHAYDGVPWPPPMFSSDDDHAFHPWDQGREPDWNYGVSPSVLFTGFGGVSIIPDNVAPFAHFLLIPGAGWGRFRPSPQM